MHLLFKINKGLCNQRQLAYVKRKTFHIKIDVIYIYIYITILVVVNKDSDISDTHIYKYITQCPYVRLLHTMRRY